MRKVPRILSIVVFMSCLLTMVLRSGVSAAEQKVQVALFSAEKLITEPLIDDLTPSQAGDLQTLSQLYNDGLGFYSSNYEPADFPLNFGPSVTQGVGDDLYIGLSSSTRYSGSRAMVARYNRDTGLHLMGSLPEQGVDQFAMADEYLIIGSADPTQGFNTPSESDIAIPHFSINPIQDQAGYYYRVDTSSATPTIELVDLVDANGDSAIDQAELGRKRVAHNSEIFVVPNESGCDTIYYETSDANTVSTIFKSEDCGDSWEVVSNWYEGRVYELMRFNDRFYQANFYSSTLEVSQINPNPSSDNLLQFSPLSQQVAAYGNTQRGKVANWVEFNGKMIGLSSSNSLFTIDSTDNIETVAVTSFNLPIHARYESLLTVAGNHLYAFDSASNNVYRTEGDASNWKWELVAHIEGTAPILSMSYWADTDSIIVGTHGANANVYAIDLQSPRNWSFENGWTNWNVGRIGNYPATSVIRAQSHVAADYDGDYGASINNLAYGHISTEVPIENGIDAGETYSLSVDIRGEYDTEISQGRYGFFVYYYNAQGERIHFNGLYSNAPLATSWDTYTRQFTVPADAVSVRVGFNFFRSAGWVNVDNFSLTKQDGTSVEILNAGFEEGMTHWKVVKASAFPATSVVRGKSGVAAGFASQHGVSINNLAYGNISTEAPIYDGIIGGETYEASIQLRGEYDAATSNGGYGFYAYFYDVEGTRIDVQSFYSKAALSTTWSEYTRQFTTPEGTDSIRIGFNFYRSAGWVNIDDMSLTRQDGTAIEILNPSFEDGFNHWKIVKSGSYPATSILRNKWGVANEKTGEYGASINNLAYGNVSTTPVLQNGIVPGQLYEASIQLRGKYDVDASQGGYGFYVYYYDAAGERIDYEGMYSREPLTTAWERYTRQFTPPAGTDSIRIGFNFYNSAGWVNVDHFNLTPLPNEARQIMPRAAACEPIRVFFSTNGVPNWERVSPSDHPSEGLPLSHDPAGIFMPREGLTWLRQTVSVVEAPSQLALRGHASSQSFVENRSFNIRLPQNSSDNERLPAPDGPFEFLVTPVQSLNGELEIELWADPEVAVTLSHLRLIDPACDEPNVPPTPNFTVSPESGYTPHHAVFDASASIDVDGGIVGYGWDFGDGSIGSGEVVTHTYTTEGVFKPQLTITDTEGATASLIATTPISVVLNLPPQILSLELANGWGTPLPGFEDEEVNYNGSEIGAFAMDPDGTIEEYHWDFGDGRTDQTIHPNRFNYTGYPDGMYMVKVEVFDNAGASTTGSFVFRAGHPDDDVPTIEPEFTVSAENPSNSLEHTFDVIAPTHQVSSYHWDFGDGSTATTRSASHTYADYGNYDVTLTMNLWGTSITGTKTLAVRPPLDSCDVLYGDANGERWMRYDGDQAGAPILSVANDPRGIRLEASSESGVTYTGVRQTITFDGPTTISGLSGLVFFQDTNPATNNFRIDFLADGETAPFQQLFKGPENTIALEFAQPKTVNTLTLNIWKDPNVLVEYRQLRLTGPLCDAGALEPPSAEFTHSREDTAAPLTVTFDATASAASNGEIVAYEWNFGDGTSGSGAQATHTYAQAGTYQVSLRTTDEFDLIGLSTQEVVVNPDAPFAFLTTDDPTSGIMPHTVNFESLSVDLNGQIMTSTFDFDNAYIEKVCDDSLMPPDPNQWKCRDYVAQGSAITSTLVFQYPGVYVVELEVEDDEGLTSTDTVTIEVFRNTAVDPEIEVANISGVAGYEVGIFGSGFGVAQGTVEILGVSAEILDWDTTFARVVIPDVAPGSHPAGLVLRDATGTQSATSEFEVYEIASQFLTVPDTSFVNLSHRKPVVLTGDEAAYVPPAANEDPYGCGIAPEDRLMENEPSLQPNQFLVDYRCQFSVSARFGADDGDVSGVTSEATIAVNLTGDLASTETLTAGTYLFQFFSRSDWSVSSVNETGCGISYPHDYQIQVSPDGVDWSRTVATITENLRGNRSHYITVPDGMRSIRMRVTDSTSDCNSNIPGKDFALKMVSVYRVDGTDLNLNESIALYGDSITAGAFNGFLDANSLNAVATGQAPADVPFTPLGFAGRKAVQLFGEQNIPNSFPNVLTQTLNTDDIAGSAFYWGIALGTNDINVQEGDGADTQLNSQFKLFGENMSVAVGGYDPTSPAFADLQAEAANGNQLAIDTLAYFEEIQFEGLIDLGKAPILARIPDSYELLGGYGYLSVKKEILNEIDRLNAHYQLIPGPDLYTEYRLNIERNRGSWMADDGTHLAGDGVQEWVGFWGDAIGYARPNSQ